MVETTHVRPRGIQRRRDQPSPPTLPNLEYDRYVSRGAFGDVFAYHDRKGRRVAVKVYRERLTNDESFSTFKERVADLMRASEDNTHIVRLHDFGRTLDGRPYIQMPWHPHTMFEFIKSQPTPLHAAVGMLVQIATALETCHRHGITHLDVKPSNILVTKSGQPALSDFRLTTSEGRGVSLHWSSPEHVSDDLEGKRRASDVYSLGATLYALLVGHSPHLEPGGDNSDSAILLRCLRGARAPVERTDVPVFTEHIIERALAVRPVDRFADAGDLAQALRQLEKGLGAAPTEPIVPTNITSSGWYTVTPLGEVHSRRGKGSADDQFAVARHRGTELAAAHVAAASGLVPATLSGLKQRLESLASHGRDDAMLAYWRLAELTDPDLRTVERWLRARPHDPWEKPSPGDAGAAGMAPYSLIRALLSLVRSEEAGAEFRDRAVAAIADVTPPTDHAVHRLLLQELKDTLGVETEQQARGSDSQIWPLRALGLLLERAEPDMAEETCDLLTAIMSSSDPVAGIEAADALGVALSRLPTTAADHRIRGLTKVVQAGDPYSARRASRALSIAAESVDPTGLRLAFDLAVAVCSGLVPEYGWPYRPHASVWTDAHVLHSVTEILHVALSRAPTPMEGAGQALNRLVVLATGFPFRASSGETTSDPPTPPRDLPTFVRTNAVRAIGAAARHVSEPVIEALREQLDALVRNATRPWESREGAANTLAVLLEAEVIELTDEERVSLSDALRDEQQSPLVRRGIALLLGAGVTTTSSEHALDSTSRTLLGVLDREPTDPLLRRAAADALCRILQSRPGSIQSSVTEDLLTCLSQRSLPSFVAEGVIYGLRAMSVTMDQSTRRVVIEHLLAIVHCGSTSRETRLAAADTLASMLRLCDARTAAAALQRLTETPLPLDDLTIARPRGVKELMDSPPLENGGPLGSLEAAIDRLLEAGPRWHPVVLQVLTSTAPPPAAAEILPDPAQVR